MRELIEYIVREIADDISVDIIESEGGIEIIAESGDIGKIIGKNGKIAKAIRVLVKAAASKQGKRVNVTISEKTA